MTTKYNIEDMQHIANSKGGKCLSKSYINTKTKLEWQCSRGHKWKAIPLHVIRGHWCRKCATELNASKRRKGIKSMQELAKSNGGKCLSKTYKNTGSKLEWQCSRGHKWKAVPDGIIHGSWCPKCGHKRGGDIRRAKIQELQKHARIQHGKLISDEYSKSEVPLIWECKEGHQWKANWSHVKRGTWCPKCANILPLGLRKLQDFAKKSGGKCLSHKYVNARSKIKWQCIKGHVWDAVPFSVLRGSWCPRCNESRMETFTRNIFKQIFNTEFPKSWPKWLVNKSNNRMELDGYSKKLRLGFEYQGIQHYESVPYLNTNIDLLAQKMRDKQKKQFCKENNVSLIIIPYTLHYTKFKDLIISECSRFNITIPNENVKIDYRAAFTNKDPIYLKLRHIAKERGGKLISEFYVDVFTKLKWQCNKGHTWESVPNNIMHGKWCPYCAHRMPLGIELIKQYAEKKGGKCLSKKYTNQNTKLKMKCKEGHIFEIIPRSIVRGHWCWKCAVKKRGIKHRKGIKSMQDYAKKRGGKCLSNEYISSHSKLDWQCTKGHKWKATPSIIYRENWCPICSNKSKVKNSVRKK